MNRTFSLRRRRAVALALSACVLIVAVPTAVAQTTIRTCARRTRAMPRWRRSRRPSRRPDSGPALAGCPRCRARVTASGAAVGRVSRPALAGCAGRRPRDHDGLGVGSRAGCGRTPHGGHSRRGQQPDARDRVLGQRAADRPAVRRIRRRGAATAAPLDSSVADRDVRGQRAPSDRRPLRPSTALRRARAESAG